MSKKTPYSFRGITFIALSLFTALGAGFVYWNYQSIDRDEYRKLLERSNPVNGKVEVTPYQAKQEREEVQKEIIFNRNGNRLLVRMVSDYAEMLLNHTSESNELVESMHPVKIFMQEELFYIKPDGSKTPSQSADTREVQIIRYVEADEARYYYKSDRLIASGVKMSRFVIPGHQLVTSLDGMHPTMIGNARTVDLNPKENSLNLKAEQFQASFINEQLKLQSDEAFCSDKTIDLEGNVLMDHELGKVHSKHAQMITEGQLKHTIDLSEGVAIDLKNGNKLACDHAHIDPKQSVSYFYGGITLPEVTYSEENSNPETALTVSSKRMETYFVDQPVPTPQRRIREIRALDDVKVQYKGAFTASSDKLVWELKSDQITLKDNVVFDQESIGRLSTDREVIITRQNKSGKNELQSIRTFGKSVLVRETEKQTITCYGDVHLDHFQKNMTLESLKNEEGEISPDQQVHFQDPSGEIFADRVVIQYRYDDKKPVVDKIILQGEVRILNRLTVEVDGAIKPVQYALADEVELVPGDSVMTLTAYPSKRVLFYDKSRDLQVSAPMLKIKRDAETKKDSIKGSGDVRFNFVEKEFDELRRRFLFKQQDKMP